MKYIKYFTVIYAALLISSCDNGGGVLVTDERGAEDGIETIDFFGMESADSETIDYEPELGFAVQARGPMSISTALIGSASQGSTYRTDCDAGDVLVGLEGFATGNKVSQVDARCVEVNATGAWVGSPQSKGNPVGITSGNPFSLNCDTGHAITGITGKTSNDAVASVQIHCKKLNGSSTTSGSEKDSATVGENSWSIANQLCGSGSAATGIQGRANNELKGLGLVCNESPATAGRWSNPINWPLMAVHAVLTPQGNVFSYGFREGSGKVFDYDLWSPSQGTASTSHNTFTNNLEVFSFCNASVVMPNSGNILMPGGTKPGNNGLSDVPVYDTQSGALSRAPDMATRRWYPTTVTLPSGEILVAGGRDVVGVAANTPEIYSPETNEWRSLFGANMSSLDWSYPRLWVAEDGRVFGINRNEMYYINIQSSGAIQRAGTFSDQYLTKSEATAVMYRPGKILQLGGNVSNGTAALVIDINGSSPEVRPTNKMRISRSAWVNSQVLADGKVMAIGGSRLVNEATTAAMNAEIWDPDTEIWTEVSALKWPRLYHSNSVLLKDGTVLVSGGGNPGPVKNFNGEIFSPPYLFNDDGSPAVRPEIAWAPVQGAYGQEITLNTEASEVAKVTFIKTSSVTHSFNVEQRYMELPFSSDGAGRIQVNLPASPTVATPGYYLMFILNTRGTPSEAAILKLGSEPGVVPDPPIVVPEPPLVQVNNLLSNGGFENDKSSWLDCSSAALSMVSGRASAGTKALSQVSGACLYQEIPVQPGAAYSLNCDAYTQGSAYSSITLNMLDASYTELASESSVVTAADYTAYGNMVQAPANAAFAAVTLYSEGPTYFDSCVVSADSVNPVAPPITPPVSPPVVPLANLLTNSEFTDQKTGWYDCASEQLTTIEADAQTNGNVLKVENSGCIYQEFPVVAGKQYKLQCSAKSEGTQYSSISIQMADATYSQLDSKVSVVAPGQFQTYTSTLTAPATSATSAVTVYSEDITRVASCYVEEI